MKKGGKGGNRTLTGLFYENKTNILLSFENNPNYTIQPFKGWKEIFFQQKKIALFLQKHAFYKFLYEKYNLKWEKYISRKLLPDNVLYIIPQKTFYIIEIKYQQVQGSVDEKLQTCHFKKLQYLKLLESTNNYVEFYYLLNKEWFDKPIYKDVLNYILMMGCRYYFDEIPLEELGIIL